MKEGKPFGSGKSVDDARVGAGGASLSRISGLERHEAKKREQGLNGGHDTRASAFVVVAATSAWEDRISKYSNSRSISSSL